MHHPRVACLHSACPTEGEWFYLRAILQSRPVCSFSDAHTVDGVQLSSFQDAAHTLGLFANANEGELALRKGISSLHTPFQLCVLFIHLLINDCLISPKALWQSCSCSLSLDCIDTHSGLTSLGEDATLDYITTLLDEYGRSLDDFSLPQPVHQSTEVTHKLACWNPICEELAAHAHITISQMNADQLAALNPILTAVHNNESHLAFIDGPSGTGKTFVVNALCNFIHSLGLIVLPTATSAYAAQLLPGGRTTHSTFKVILTTILCLLSY